MQCNTFTFICSLISNVKVEKQTILIDLITVIKNLPIRIMSLHKYGAQKKEEKNVMTIKKQDNRHSVMKVLKNNKMM